MKLITNKSKNLLYRIFPVGNCTVQFGTSYAIATQISADSASVNNFKIQGWDGTKYTELVGKATAIGKLTTTFTTPSTTGFKLIRFGLNGASMDTLCRCDMDLKPSTTYTFTCNFTNITQGSISWKDMMLVEGSTVEDYEPYSYNLLDKWQYAATQTINGVTFTNNGDGTITYNGVTSVGANYSLQSGLKVVAGHKYLSYVGENTNDKISVLLYANEDPYDTFDNRFPNAEGGISTALKNSNELYYQPKPRSNISFSGFILKPQLYDLTLMYGAGKEPTTVNQFYTDHPELKVSPLGFIGLKNIEISNKNIKKLRYKTADGVLDLGIIPSNSGYILDKYNNLTEELLEENIEKPTGSWNNSLNMLDKSKYPATTTTNGVTFTNNGDGSITVNGKSTANTTYVFNTNNFPTTHKYLLIGCPEGGSKPTFNLSNSTNNTVYYDVGNGVIFDMTGDDWYQLRILVYSVVIVNNLTFYPQLYDLTAIYGPGNEPTTVGEFYKDYPGLKTTANYHIPNKTNILLNKVDGKTNKIVQLADKSKYDGTSTTRGITFTNNGNGTITINGTNDGTDYSNHSITNSNYLTNDWLKGHKYLFYFSDRTDLNYYAVIGGNTSKMEYTELGNTSTGRNPLWTILSPTDNSIGGNSWYILRVKQNAVCTNELASPQVFDLTAMYGFGNEPTTVEQFKKDYPQFFDEKLDGIWNVRTSGISTTGKNLFDIDKWIFSVYDVGNGTLIERLSNGAICQGNSGDGSASYSNGWFRPMSYQYPNSIYLQAGTYTLSADYTMIENSAVSTAQVICHLYGDNNYPGSAFTSAPVGSTVKVKNTYTVEEGIYYPIFTLNSGKVKIENIQIELNSTATAYEPYQENKIDLLSIQTLNGINGVNDYIEVIDKGNGLYDLKKTQNIDSVDLGTLDWAADGANFSSSSISSVIKPPTNDNSVGNYTCQKYVNVALNKSFVDGDFGVNSSGGIYFRNSACTTAAAFKTAMNGVIFYYQLKTPVTATIATNLTYNQESAIRTNGGLLLVNDNNNQKYVQPNVTLKENYQYKS